MVDILKPSSGRKIKPFKMVVSGVNGSGKTTLASTMKNPVIIDLEGGSSYLDVNRLEAKTYADVLDIFNQFKEKEHNYKTIVLDSLDWFETSMEESIVADASQKKQGIEDIADIPQFRGYSLSQSKMKSFLNLCSEVVDTGVNVVLICHTAPKEVTNDPLIPAHQKWVLKLRDKNAGKVKEWCDFLLFTTYDRGIEVKGDFFNKQTTAKEKGERVMYTSGVDKFDAKSRIPILNEEGEPVLPLKWSAFNEVYRKAMGIDSKEDKQEVTA